MLQKALLFLLVLNVGCARQDAGGARRRGRDEFESLVDVFDPTFLSGVWPKIANGVHLSLEQACWDHVAALLHDLAGGRAWAYRAVDASGRYQSALFAGSRFWLGSKQECLRLDENFQEDIDNETLALLRNNDYINTVLRRQKYFDADLNEWRYMVQPDELVARLAAADARPPFRLVYTTLQLQLNVSKITVLQSHDIVLGVCLPKSCPSDDVESIINFSIMLSDNLKNNRTVPRTVKITSSRRIREFQIQNDAGAILLITVTAVLVLVATIATLVDLDLMKCIRYKKQSMSFDLPTYNSSETKLVDELKRKHGEVKCIDDILSESPNLDLVSASKISRSPSAHTPVTLDVVNIGTMSGSCNRCGKYKRQCPNSKPVDSSVSCPRLKYSSFASLSTEDRRKNNFFCRLLLCFSVCYCWKRVFNKTTANKDLSLIHVMRIVATLWVIFVHVAVMVGYISDDTGDIKKRDSLYYIMASGTIAFDTLFFVSGLFSAHHFFYLKSRYSVEQLVSFSGACGDLMQFLCTVTNRVIRLVPSYAYAVLLSAVVSRASRESAALALPDADHRACDLYWWRNLLYVSNAYPPREQCLQISWYLSTETQLHALGAVACAASAAATARARLVVLVATAFALAATAADVSSAFLDNDVQYTDTYSVYAAVIERGWARVAPYFVGLFAGWLVHVMHGRLKLTKVLSSLLWGASLPLLAASAALPYVQQAWLAAWLHLAWPCALLWPVLAACTFYAAWFRRMSGGACAALSRLSYSMLLLHGAVARALLLSADTALCSHVQCVWVYWAGVSGATLVAALFLALLVEMPSCGLFRRLSDCANT